MSSAVAVGDILQEYAQRGVFRGFSRQGERASRGEYYLQWHRDQVFQLEFDARRHSLRVACVLPNVPAKSTMYREFRQWLRQRQAAELPEHRRYDPQRLGLRTYNRAGDIALTLTMLDGDIDYGVRRLVALVNEIYLDFLTSGLYYDWAIETFELDPDNPF